VNGYAGNILDINLTTNEIKIKRLDPQFAKKYIGGIGFNARFLYDEVPAGADPLGEENILVFSTGALVGSPFPTTSRTEASAKSPLTNGFGTSNSGAFWGMQLKNAGYDSIIIRGKSDKPVYIKIINDNIEILDAASLWGHDSWETVEVLKKKYYGCEVAQIGQGGENLVKFANIENGYFGGWGRTGLGAVMGSKLLKAIVVKGTKGIRPKDPKGLLEISKEGQDLIASAGSYQAFCEYGSMNAVIPYGNFKALAAHNFTKGVVPDWKENYGKQVCDEYSNRHIACQSCNIACAHWVEIKEGKYKGLKVKDMEVTPTIAWGINAGLPLEDTIKSGELCRRYGVDMVSSAGAIAFAMQIFEEGILTTEDLGYELKFGDAEAAFKLLEDIIYRRGIGDLLADGVKIASEKLSAEEYAVHVKGLDLPQMDVRRRWSVWAFGMLTNIRGGDHLRCRNPVENLRFNENTPDLAKEKFGFKKPMYDKLDMPEDLKAEAIDLESDMTDIAKMSKWSEDLINLSNSIGLCIRPPVMEKVGPTILSRVYQLYTGINITPEELMKAAERGWNLAKMFNIKHGEKFEDIKFPERFYKEELFGSVLDKEKSNNVLKDYLIARGWDTETSRPTEEKLAELGISFEGKGM